MLVDIETLPIDTVGHLEPINADSYPYFELLLSISVSDGMKRPLHFSDDHGLLTCIEGKHRFQVLTLLYKTDPEYFKKVIGKVEVVICSGPIFVCESPNGIDSSWLTMVEKVRNVYSQFIHSK